MGSRNRGGRFLWLACALVVAGLVPARAAGDVELTPEFVDRLDAALDARGFTGVLDVRAGDRTLWRRVSGAAKSTRSVFWVGSVSKQFAAVAALRLVDRGELSLDAPVADALGLGGGALRLDGTPCTLAHVLNHTCGLPAGNVCMMTGFDEPAVQDRFLRCVAGLKLASKPGEKLAYSNVGYDLVGVLVARTAGTSYGAFLKKELFDPLGLGSTGVDLRANPDARRRLVQGEAFDGTGWARTWPWLLLDPAGPGTAGAAGNVFSTADDLHAWNRELHGGRVLSPASYARLVTPALDDYGFGLVIDETPGGTRWIWHNGSLTPMGWSSFVAYVPSVDVSVVGLANRGRHTSHVMRATRSLVFAALGEKVETPILQDPTDRDLAVELFFFVVPLLVAGSLVWLGWTLVRGPRRGAVRWYGSVLGAGALYLFAVSLFDFYGRAAWMSPPLLVAAALGLAAHRKRLDVSFRRAWADGKERRAIVGQALAVGLLGVVSPPVARVWLVVFVTSMAGWVYLLGGAPRRVGKRPGGLGRSSMP